MASLQYLIGIARVILSILVMRFVHPFNVVSLRHVDVNISYEIRTSFDIVSLRHVDVNIS